MLLARVCVCVCLSTFESVRVQPTTHSTQLLKTLVHIFADIQISHALNSKRRRA